MSRDDSFKIFNKFKKKSYSKTKQSKTAYENDVCFQRNSQICRRPKSKVMKENLAPIGDCEDTTFKDNTTTDVFSENRKDLLNEDKCKNNTETSQSEMQYKANEMIDSNHKILKNISVQNKSTNYTVVHLTSMPKVIPTIKKSFPKLSVESDYIGLPKVYKKSFFALGKKGKEFEMDQLRDMKNEININDHLISQADLFINYKTDPEKGLSEHEVMKRFNQYGANALPQTTEESNFYLLAGYIFKGFSALLWFGAVLSFLAYILEAQSNLEKPKDNLWLGIILVLTCVVTGIFSYYQEMKGSQILDSFKQMIPTRTTVIRDATVKEINAAGLVKGDIVLLKMGDKVPADIRLIESNYMKVENSSLTGELEPVSCTLEPTNSYYVESRNLVFFSTNIVSGYGKGVVILTGCRTVMGKIAGLTNNLEKKQTPIELEIENFIKIISTWALFLGFVCFILAMCVGYSWLTASVYVIAIIVANVPEGLLATLTVSLTLTAKRLADKNCIVKRLQVVETLGSIRTICSDKTGTLTQNKMKVVHISINNKEYEVSDGVTLVDQSIIQDCTYKTLLRAACLCSQTDSESSQENIPPMHIKTSGDATEVGITHFVKNTVQTFSDVRNAFPKVAEIPFNSLNKYSMTVHLSPLNQHFVILKGAPEVVMEKCTAFLVGEKEYFFTAEVQYDLEATIKRFASRGERVIAFGDKYLLRNEYPVNFKFKTDPVNFPTEEFRFIGLISLFDPPKHEVPKAIATCRGAGIRIIMVTGDHPLTAKSIAISVNILPKNAPDSCVISGMELRKMTDSELRKLLYENEELIFARTSPIQKLKIVEQCQSLDEIVAVIGDGVNDAPALKKADIGIAMGITGSDVSKQTADMILMDDNFATIVSGIEEGRLIFDNLKKSIAYVLASNIPEIAPFLAYIFLGIPLPVSTVTVLCIDLGTDMWPAISLAYEKPERNILKRRSRNPKKDRLVSRKLVMYAYLHIGFFETLAGFLTYFHVLADAGWLPHDLLYIRQKWESNESIEDSFGKHWSRAERIELECTSQTAYFIAIVIAQWADVIICKTRYHSIFQQKMNNVFLNLGIIFETLVACFVAYTPYVNNALRTRPVSLKYWITPLPMAVFIVLYDEIRKAFSRNNPRSILAREFTY